jgi:hypothetical protein
MAHYRRLLAVMIVVGTGLFTRAVAAQEPAPAPAKNDLVFALLRANTNEDREAFERAQIILIKSRPILELALTRGGVAELQLMRDLPEPVAWLERNLRVDFMDDGKTLRIALRGNDSQVAAVVNAVTDIYMQHVQLQKQRQLKKLNDQLAFEHLKLRLALEKMLKAGGGDREIRAQLLRIEARRAQDLAVQRERLARETIPLIHVLYKAKAPPIK